MDGRVVGRSFIIIHTSMRRTHSTSFIIVVDPRIPVAIPWMAAHDTTHNGKVGSELNWLRPGFIPNDPVFRSLTAFRGFISLVAAH